MCPWDSIVWSRGSFRKGANPLSTLRLAPPANVARLGRSGRFNPGIRGR